MFSSLLFCLASAFPATASLHANSISVSSIEISESKIRHELELQTLSVLEVLPDIDLNQDGLFDNQELELGRTNLQEYLDQHYSFRIESSPDRPLETAITSIEEHAADTGNFNFSLQRILVVRERSLAALPTSVDIDVSVFSISSPDHRDFCTLEFQDQLAEQRLFTTENASWEYLPDAELESRLTRAFAINGFETAVRFNILGLLLLLSFACPAVRSAKLVLGSFLLAGGFAAGAAALFDIQLSDRLVLLTMALAIPYVGFENALRGKARRPQIEAVLFGLVMGIHLVQLLRPELEDLPLANRAILAHACGFAGTAILIVLTLLWFLPKIKGHRDEESQLGPNWLRNQGSIALSILGLIYFVQLAWFSGASS